MSELGELFESRLPQDRLRSYRRYEIERREWFRASRERQIRDESLGALLEHDLPGYLDLLSELSDLAAEKYRLAAYWANCDGL
jgi:hypothetical protein